MIPSGNALKFRIDNTSGNRMVAEDLKPRVLEYLKDKGKATTSEIYQDLNCGDIPLYLALHDLVNEKKIKGISPYDEKAEAGPKLYEYIPSGSLISKLSSEDIPIMSDARAKSQLRSITQKYTNDIYRNEEYWKPVNEMVKEIQRVIPTYSVVESSYDRSNPPKYKTWVLMGAIKNPDGKIRVVWSQIRANGAGTPEDPMKDYDLTCVTEVISPRNIQDTKQQEYLQVLLQTPEENPAMPSKLSSLLDDIANRLEAKGLMKEAYQVDVVANTLGGGLPGTSSANKYPNIKSKIENSTNLEVAGIKLLGQRDGKNFYRVDVKNPLLKITNIGGNLLSPYDNYNTDTIGFMITD